MRQAQQARKPVALTVGMKALGWPEFFVPTSVKDLTGLSQGQDVASDPSLRAATLAFEESTVRRYRDNPALVAWQIENEPFNRAGPPRLWIDAKFPRDEIPSARQLGGRQRRPLVHAV